MTRRERQSEQREAELDAELRFDYEQRIAANLRAGMSATEAQRAARLAFGGLEQVKEECRDVRRFRFLDSFGQDVRYALRGMRSAPGFTAVAVTMLALGIGVNAMVFTLANTVLFKGFPLVKQNDSVVYISGQGGVSWPDFQDWQAQAKSFAGMAVVADLAISVTDNTSFPESYNATRVSTNAFSVAGVTPIRGRDFEPADGAPGADPVAILSYRLWQSRYAADENILSRLIRINGAPTAVVGVMPQGFTFPQRQDLWVPITPTPDLLKREARGLWFVFARLNNGVTLPSARAEMTAIGARLASAYPQTNKTYVPGIKTFTQNFMGKNATTVYGSLWGAVGFVLLIVCANVANLLLSRAVARSREISLRIALGAGRWRIIRQLLIEGVILSSIGGMFGWWIARFGVRAWDSVAGPPSWFDHVLDYSMDYQSLLYLIAISIGTGVLFALAPAVKLSSTDINASLKDGGHGTMGSSRGRHLSTVLVTVEMALAVILLTGAGVMMKTFLNLYRMDIGIDPAKILTMQLGLPAARYPTATSRIAFHDRLRTQLDAIPGVESSAVASHIPGYGSMRIPYEVAGDASADEQSLPKLSALLVSPTYFRTLGLTLVAGRVLTDADGISAPPALVVNQRFAKQYWPGENPLGKRLRLHRSKTPEDWMTVVGVVSNIEQYRPGDSPALNALAYLPYRQDAAPFAFVLERTSVSPSSVETAVRRAVLSVDPDLPISYMLPLPDRLAWGYSFSGSIALLFVAFAGIALLLAAIGLHAVVSYSVGQRTREFGVRMAIGASAADILGLVFRQGMLPLGVGLLIGIAASFSVIRLLKGVLVQVSPADPGTLAAPSVLLILAAALGCLLPARRAMRVDPAIALRQE